MRIRSIKPEFFKHDTLGAMSPTARILFIGLWCMADCAGRLEDRPKRIKVEVLPYDDDDVETLLTELCNAGLIIRYTADGKQLIEIPSFARHQRISGKEADNESRFPGVPPIATRKKRGSSGEAAGKHPESLETEGRRKGDGDVAFERFWFAYPKKKAKESAVRAFAKVDTDVETLIAAIERAKQDADWRKEGGKYIPFPATWLNGKRWEDQSGAELFTEPMRPAVAYDAKPEY